ncbi:TonB-dependent receptor [Brevundimonas sp. S30B]|uniref:TonB-dependent receptor n=1 Tax=unclassified Brevundimonas TaxID=2622653 RepID=UPI001072B7BF|nr:MULTISPECIES: TonB-dependent receptor [unclassified Brevundimonas]QBX37430.1 TonB-dependent receptor [Brevundimonas sp. MF30-B]TFW03777.1 TonB-dependent receptor [Brevundimonas sp. S30B]
MIIKPVGAERAGLSLKASAGALIIAAALGAAAPVLADVVGDAAAVQNTLTGRVSDASGASLPGARVVIRELGFATSTDRQGRYILPSMPAGQYTVEVDYLGYPTMSRQVTVAAGVATVADITVSDVTEVAEIVVVGSLSDGVARALNQQRTADNTSNVVSSDSIGRFPDSNIAEALQRVPGIGVERDQGEGNFVSLRGSPAAFTSITVDGVSIPGTSPDTRAVDLGALPSEVVSSLEINKTLLPSQDADSIAGSINLVTRSAFDSRGRNIRLNAGGSYNEMGSTNDRRASVVASDTFGPDRQFGAVVSASYAKTDRRVDNIESAWDLIEDADENDILGVPVQEFKDYDTRRERLSLTGALEYRPDALNRYFVRGTWARRTDDEFRNLLAILYEDGTIQPGATEQSASFTAGRFAREFRHRVVRDENLAISAGGEHDINTMTLDYTVSFARGEQTYPNRQQLLFRSTARPDLSYDFSGDFDNPNLSLFTSQEHLNPANYAFREHVNRWQSTTQDETAAEINLSIPTTLFNQPAEWKFGGRLRQRDIESDEESFRNRDASARPALGFADLLSDTPSRNFDYDLGFKYDADLVLDYFGSQGPLTAAPAYRRIANSTTTDYTAQEDIYAAYGMTRIQFDRANLILGLRVERTDFEGAAPVFNEDTEDFTVSSFSRSYTEVFPNATLRYAFSDNLVGRVALTRGIARPRYRDNVPRISESGDRTAGEVIDLTAGNPDLKPTLSNNFDASLEYYYEPLGVISAGVFYKDLEDYVFELTSRGTYAGLAADITRPENAPDGFIRGVEFNYQQQFTFLPGWLSGFGVAANYTWTDAEMTLPFAGPGRGTKAALPNQSDTTVNLSAFYETARFNARLAWTDRSDFLQEFNYGDPRLDIYWEGRSQLDFTADFDVTEHVNVYLEAKNLTDSEGVRYAGVRSRPTERERFGRLFFVGARVNF